MEALKEKAIKSIVNATISAFAEGLLDRYTADVDNPEGVINAKKNNFFMAELGEELMFYSAFVRSFDSSFGNVLEGMGNDIAQLSYEVRGEINGFILPEQIQRKSSLIESYRQSITPEVSHYSAFTCLYPKNIESYRQVHQTDNYFYNKETNTHYLIELKAGGDLDTKKAPAEKDALLHEYFLLKNSLKDDKNAQIKLYFATAYNKYGEGNPWRQSAVQRYFANEELLIGKDYWDFVCDDKDGFKIVKEQYKISAIKIKSVLQEIKDLYF